MNRNVFFNTVVVVLLVVGIICGIVLTIAVDELRYRVESVSDQLKSISAQSSLLSRKLDQTNVVVRSDGHTGTSTSPSSAGQQVNPDRNPDQSMANTEFYDKDADSGGRLIEAEMNETKNLNYIVNNEFLVAGLWELTFDSVSARNNLHPEVFEPQLAESWSLSENKMEFTIKLKKGVLWHDFTDPVTGKKWTDVEVTAHDFKFYVDVVKNEDVDCAPSRVSLNDLDRIEVINDYEFKVYWKKKYFRAEEITLSLTPLPRHLYHAYDGPFDGKKFNDDHRRNRMIVGCGPYRFLKWQKGQKVILVPWEKYYGRKYGVMPRLKTRAIEMIPHPNTQLQALKAGRIDKMKLTAEQWVRNTNTEEFNPETGSIRKLKYQGRNYYYLGYNLTRELFKDKLVRQALTHLVNRKRILKDVVHDLGRITTGPFFIDSPYYDKTIEPYPFSVKKAKELFRKAGWTDSDGDGILDKNGKKFEFTLIGVTPSPKQERMLPIIKEDMAKAGVVVNLSFIEWSVYTQRLENKNFDVCCLGWGLSYESDPYQLWHSSQATLKASSNHIGFANEQADRLIEKIRTCFDLQKRIKLCHEFHKLLHEEQPYTFLFSQYTLIAQSGRYRNVRVFPLGIDTRIMWTPFREQKTLEY